VELDRIDSSGAVVDLHRVPIRHPHLYLKKQHRLLLSTTKQASCADLAENDGLLLLLLPHKGSGSGSLLAMLLLLMPHKGSGSPWLLLLLPHRGSGSLLAMLPLLHKG
jgi:hypothetical protein